MLFRSGQPSIDNRRFTVVGAEYDLTVGETGFVKHLTLWQKGQDVFDGAGILVPKARPMTRQSTTGLEPAVDAPVFDPFDAYNQSQSDQVDPDYWRKIADLPANYVERDP